MRWFTADLHLGDLWASKLRYCPGDVPKMHEQLASRWDRRVKKDDTIWILGDIFFPEWFEEEQAAEWLSARPGRKHVVLGNHDDAATISRLPVSHIMHKAYLHLGGEVIATLSHYPETDAGNGLLLHGHTHRPQKWQVREDGQINLHVGWDAWRRPVSETELVEIWKEARDGTD